MSVVLFGDFETRSAADLTVCGADVYARHPTTDILCFGYAFDNEEPEIWRPGDKAPKRVLDHVASGGIFVGHNTGGFEVPIWNHVCRKKYGWPELKIEQVDCTMARSYAMGLPGKLEKAAPAVGIKDGKDMAGNRVMLQLSRPKNGPDENCRDCDGTGVFYGNVTTCPCVEWWDEIEYLDKYVALYEYCKKDIIVERELHKRVVALSPQEKHIFNLDHRINQRGVCVDLAAIRKAIEIAELEKDRMNEEIRRITQGSVATFSAVAQFVHWINSKGIKTESIAKADVIELLEREDLPSDVREALLIRQLAAKSSTAKLKAMIEGACSDGRIRGVFQYHGAGTGRWAGRRVQLHNLPRPNLKQEEIEEICDLLGSP